MNHPPATTIAMMTHPPLIIKQQSSMPYYKVSPAMATATPSGQTLLLDPAMAGRLYINGRYVTTWGQDTRLGSHFPALFGMDLHSIAFWHGRVMDFDTLKIIYAQLLQEILADCETEKPIVRVLNKIDLLDSDVAEQLEYEAALYSKYTASVYF